MRRELLARNGLLGRFGRVIVMLFSPEHDGTNAMSGLMSNAWKRSEKGKSYQGRVREKNVAE